MTGEATATPGEAAAEEMAEEQPPAAPEATAETTEEATSEAAPQATTEATAAATAEATPEATAAATAEATAEAAAESAEQAAAAGQERIHVVQAGENLYRIGLQYGVSWAVIAQVNNLPNANAIFVGQQLRIPADPNTGGTPTPTPVPLPTQTTYVVQPGDTLARIARSFNVTWQEIAAANNLVNPNRITVGQVLKIPGTAPAPQLTHTVQPRETLFLISLQYGVPWTSIASANNLTAPYVIYPGQTLIIPGASQ
jgi:LysM repeat protein